MTARGQSETLAAEVIGSYTKPLPTNGQVQLQLIMLNPQWLRTFAALTELGNFTRAAERLDLTQAAVSQHLHHLEDALGLLVIRRPRAIELTPAGRALLDYCEAMEQARRRLDARVSGPAEAGEIGLITPESIGLALFPLMLDWQAQHPQWKIRYCFAPDPEVLDAVLTNRYDLGIVTLKPDDTRLTARKFMQEPLELVVPAGAKVRAWSHLETLGFIDHPDGRAMANRLLSRRFRKNASVADLPRNGFSNQIALILEFVARGLGFTVIPRYARAAFAQQHQIEVVECGSPVVETLWLIHRAEWPLPAPCARAVRYLEERMKGSAR